MGRITTLLEQGKIEADLGLPRLNKETDRVMICGSPEMLRDLRVMLESQAWVEGHMHSPGHFVIERAFAGNPAYSSMDRDLPPNMHLGAPTTSEIWHVGGVGGEASRPSSYLVPRPVVALVKNRAQRLLNTIATIIPEDVTAQTFCMNCQQAGHNMAECPILWHSHHTF